MQFEHFHAKQITRAIVAAQVSRFPTLMHAAHRFARRGTDARDEIEYSRYLYSAFRPLCRGGRTLEIGPGPGVGVSLLLARDGCEAVAMDFVDLRTPGLHETYRTLLEGKEALVRFVLGSIDRIPFQESSFDFVFSNSCFEHVRDPNRATREIGRILRAGGRTVHQIDFRDHRCFDDPLRFLQYDDRLWALMNSRGPGHQNRWRLSQYVDTFEQLGFHVAMEVNMVAEPHHMPSNRTFAKRFRGMSREDLTTLSARLVADLDGPKA